MPDVGHEARLLPHYSLGWEVGGGWRCDWNDRTKGSPLNPHGGLWLWNSRLEEDGRMPCYSCQVITSDVHRFGQFHSRQPCRVSGPEDPAPSGAVTRTPRPQTGPGRSRSRWPRSADG